MPALSLNISRPQWTSTAEQRLWSLLHNGYPPAAAMDTLVAELADTLHITCDTARREIETHLDLAGVIQGSPQGGATPLIRTVGQTPKAALLNWGSPPTSPKTPTAFPPVPGRLGSCERVERVRRPRAKTESSMRVTFQNSDPDVSPREMKVEVRLSDGPISTAVVAPGGGTGINGAIYSELGRNPSFKAESICTSAEASVEVVGRSRAPYDVYPPGAQQKPRAFCGAEKVLETRVHERVKAMVFGSRGGQVAGQLGSRSSPRMDAVSEGVEQVLPEMWQAEAAGAPPVPPAVVINGGCAMKLPTPVLWPDSAVTFLLIGGKDNFRGHMSIEDYVTETRTVRICPHE
ncbi:unnamed protein product [Effrenium voratum]|nr:unnamed protein product [Effrenium voratum]